MKTTVRPRRLARKVSSKDHARGSPFASITLVSYGDFASPACVKTYRTVKAIQKRLGTRLRYVFRSFPQPSLFPHAQKAAEAAECASGQEKFWEMHDRIFEGQLPADEKQLSRHASEAGLDVIRFRREMRARLHAPKIRAVKEGGARSGVTRAPTFFINSVRHESSFGLSTLLAAVQAASGG